MVFAKPEDIETCPDHLNFRFSTKIRSSLYFPIAAWIFLRKTSLVTCSVRCWVTFGSISPQKPASFSLALPSRSMTHTHREVWIGQGSASVSPLIQETCLSLHIDCSFVRAAVAFAIFERTSGFEPSFETIAPKYLKPVTIPSFWPLTLISLWMSLPLFVTFFHLKISLFHPFSILSRDKALPMIQPKVWSAFIYWSESATNITLAAATLPPIFDYFLFLFYIFFYEISKYRYLYTAIQVTKLPEAQRQTDIKKM